MVFLSCRSFILVFNLFFILPRKDFDKEMKSTLDFYLQSFFIFFVFLWIFFLINFFHKIGKYLSSTLEIPKFYKIYYFSYIKIALAYIFFLIPFFFKVKNPYILEILFYSFICLSNFSFLITNILYFISIEKIRRAIWIFL